MEKAVQSTAEVSSLGAAAKGESGLFSTESVLHLQKLIFAGSPLHGDSAPNWRPGGVGVGWGVSEAMEAFVTTLARMSGARGDPRCGNRF